MAPFRQSGLVLWTLKAANTERRCRVDQLQLFVIRQGDQIKVALDPRLRGQLISLMAEAIETVDLARRRLKNEFYSPKDRC